MTDVNVPAAVALRTDVNDLIDSKREDVRSRVVDFLAEEILASRAELLKKSIVKREKMAEGIQKISPDVIHFDDKGQKVAEYFSKQRSDELKRAKEKLVKLDGLIGKAITDGLQSDYNDLKKFDEQDRGEQGKQTQQGQGKDKGCKDGSCEEQRMGDEKDKK